MGWKTPAEALAIFKEAGLPSGELRKILERLRDSAEAQEAMEHVLKAPQCIARKFGRFQKKEEAKQS